MKERYLFWSICVWMLLCLCGCTQADKQVVIPMLSTDQLFFVMSNTPQPLPSFNHVLFTQVILCNQHVLVEKDGNRCNVGNENPHDSPTPFAEVKQRNRPYQNEQHDNDPDQI